LIIKIWAFLSLLFLEFFWFISLQILINFDLHFIWIINLTNQVIFPLIWWLNLELLLLILQRIIANSLNSDLADIGISLLIVTYRFLLAIALCFLLDFSIRRRNLLNILCIGLFCLLMNWYFIRLLGYYLLILITFLLSYLRFLSGSDSNLRVLK
jgi:hypothetical protein